MSILEIVASHIWNDNYPLSSEARARVTEGRIKDFERLYPKVWYRRSFYLDTLNGNYDACMFLLKQPGYRMYYPPILEIAAENGDYTTVKKLVERNVPSRTLWLHAARGGNVEIVKDFVSLVDLDKVALEAARYNRTDALDWCCVTIKEMLSDGVVKAVSNSEIAVAAASGGHLDLVKRSVKRGARNYYAIALAAAETGHLDVIKYTEGRYKTLHEIVRLATKNGHLNILEHLFEKLDISKHAGHIARMATMYGQTEVFMRYITRELAGRCLKFLECAANRGNLEIVKYIVDNCAYDIYIERCFWCGHLNIVKFLYETYGNVVDPSILIATNIVNKTPELMAYLLSRLNSN